MKNKTQIATLRGVTTFKRGGGFIEPTDVLTGHDGDPQDASDKLNGHMSRRAPAPLLDPAKEHIIEWARQLAVPGAAKDFSRLLYLIGGPGSGKTEIGLAMAQAFGFDIEFVPAGSCAGDFSRLAIDYQFGTERASGILTQVNDILQEGEEHEKQQLRLGLKGKLNKEGDAIDILSLGDDGEYLENVENIRKLLNTVRPDASRATAVDVKEVTGELLEKLITYVEARREAKAKGLPEPKPLVIILDELNRYVNLDKLWQNFWEPAGGTERGAIMEYRDKRGNRAKFTFTQEDLETVFFVGTGNQAVKDLTGAFADRATIMELGEFGELNVAHRMQQLLMGLPVVTWVAAMEAQNNAPLTEAQRDFISNIARDRHQLGLSEAERRNIPAMQHELLEQSIEVSQGIGMISKAWVWLDKLKNGQAGVDVTNSGKIALKRLEVSPRKLSGFIGSALGNSMSITTGEDSFNGDSKGYQPTDPKVVGTRLVEELLRKIEYLRTAEPGLYDICLRQFYNYGVITKRQLSENCIQANELDKEVRGLEKRSIDDDALTAAELINCDGFARQFANRGPLRDALCDSMRTLIPGLGADNDKILKLSEVASLMKEVEARSKGEEGQLPSLAMLAFKKGEKSKITADLIDTKVVAPFAYDNADREIGMMLKQMNISKADQTALGKCDKALDAARESFARATIVEEQSAASEAMIAAMEAKTQLETKIVKKAIADGRDIITKKVREKDKGKEPETVALGPIALDHISKRDTLRRPVLEVGMVLADRIPTREQFLATLLVSGEGLSNQLQNFSRTLPDRTGTPTSGFAKILAGTHPSNIVVGSSRWRVGDNQQGMLFMHFKGNPLATDLDQQRPMTIILGNDPIDSSFAEILQKRQNILYFSRTELAADEKNRDLLWGAVEQLLEVGAFRNKCEGKKPEEVAKVKVSKDETVSLFSDLRSAVGNCGSFMSAVLESNGSYEERMAEFIHKDLTNEGKSLLVHNRTDGSDRIVPAFFVPQLDIVHKGRVDESKQVKAVE